jgi:hypothetical protein
LNQGRRSARPKSTSPSNSVWIPFVRVMAPLRRDGCALGDSATVEKLVARLRATPEWRYVDKEVDIGLSRA